MAEVVEVTTALALASAARWSGACAISRRVACLPSGVRPSKTAGGLGRRRTGRRHLDGVRERRRRRSRVERVDPDPAVGDLLRRRPHESHLVVLGSDVRADLRTADRSEDARRDDHTAAVGESGEPVFEDVAVGWRRAQLRRP